MLSLFPDENADLFFCFVIVQNQLVYVEKFVVI